MTLQASIEMMKQQKKAEKERARAAERAAARPPKPAKKPVERRQSGGGGGGAVAQRKPGGKKKKAKRDDSSDDDFYDDGGEFYAPHQPLIPEPESVTFEMKRELAVKIVSFEGENLERAIDIIRQGRPDLLSVSNAVSFCIQRRLADLGLPPT